MYAHTFTARYDDGGEVIAHDPFDDRWRPLGHCDPSEDILPAVGARVEIYWPGMKRWFSGTATAVDAAARCFHVEYDDWLDEEIRLRTVRTRMRPHCALRELSHCSDTAGADTEPDGHVRGAAPCCEPLQAAALT